jgi:isochorismate hydrolase
MKYKIYLIGLTILSVIISSKSFSQGQSGQKTQIKPALLVIDIQNAFLKMIPEREKEVAMANINGYIELFRSYGYPIIRIYNLSKENGVDKL